MTILARSDSSICFQGRVKLDGSFPRGRLRFPTCPLAPLPSTAPWPHWGSPPNSGLPIPTRYPPPLPLDDCTTHIVCLGGSSRPFILVAHEYRATPHFWTVASPTKSSSVLRAALHGDWRTLSSPADFIPQQHPDYLYIRPPPLPSFAGVFPQLPPPNPATAAEVSEDVFAKQILPCRARQGSLTIWFCMP